METIEYIRFDPANKHLIDGLGLSHHALGEIFLSAEGDRVFPCSIVEGASPSIRAYIEREYRAASLSFDGIVEGQMSCPDPWGGEWVAADWVITSPKRFSLPFEMLSVYYRCQSAGGRTFWLCIYETYGRATQVFFPDLNCAIYDFQLSLAQDVVRTLHATLAAIPREVIDGIKGSVPVSAKRIGLLDMVTNFGHQLLNHLSGIQRLAEEALIDRLDEIWLCGTEFYGAVENIFPELRNRVRRFDDRWAVQAELLQQRVHLFKLGSNLVTAQLRQRILSLAGRFADTSHQRLVITIRADGRRCLNLPEVVAQAYASLSVEHSDLRIVLDGWVIPESDIRLNSSLATAIREPLLSRIRAEMDLAEKISSSLPSGVVVGNTIGLSMLESIASLSGASAYLSHIGTLQHKLGILVGIPGVVHGPQIQLQSPETGPFMSEVGFAPYYLPVEAVKDVKTTSERGAGFHDYSIADANAVIAGLDRVLKLAAERG